MQLSFKTENMQLFLQEQIKIDLNEIFINIIEHERKYDI
jgi:hypothetical protein